MSFIEERNACFFVGIYRLSFYKNYDPKTYLKRRKYG